MRINAKGIPAPYRQLAPFVLLAALLHLAVLLGFKPFAVPSPLLPRPLEVRIEHIAPSPSPKSAPLRSKAMTNSTGGLRHNRAEVTPNSNAPTPVPIPQPVTAPLDMNKLLDQAREYTRQSPGVGAQPTNSLEGEYSGSYSGFDVGTLNFWLDRSGHGSGSGQSSRYGITFIIRGQVDQDGSIRMSGSGVAAEAKFNGTLNPSTGEFSGKWMLTKNRGGTFRGQRDHDIGQVSPIIVQIAPPIERLKQAMQQTHSEITLASGLRKITTESGTSVCYQPVPNFARDMPGLFGIPTSCP
jgi:hypothetical protein